MNNTYYIAMRKLAQDKRAALNLNTTQINISKVNSIYSSEGIVIDRWKGKLVKLKAAYFNDECGCSVLINQKLPVEPRLFALLHELKHHYVDQDRLKIWCRETNNRSPIIEIGAEVFAAEFIFPEEEFVDYIKNFISPSGITPEDIVRMKYHSPVPISYTFFVKRLERLRFIPKGKYAKVQFTKLHERMYGSRHYRQSRNS